VHAALSSVAAQSYASEYLEAIVVDNASTDATAAVVREFAGYGLSVPVALVHETEPGVARVKNTGAAAARADVLIFLDADSRMDPRLISDVAQAYRSGHPAGSIRVYADSTNLIDRGFFDLMEIGKVWFGVRGQMLYCERTLFLQVGGFHPELRLAEDLEFLDRIGVELARRGLPPVCHIHSSGIATSPRRLRSRPFRLGMITMFARWALAFTGIGRSREY